MDAIDQNENKKALVEANALNLASEAVNFRKQFTAEHHVTTLKGFGIEQSKSARLPTAIEPISSCMPNTRAGFALAARRADSSGMLKFTTARRKDSVSGVALPAIVPSSRVTRPSSQSLFVRPTRIPHPPYRKPSWHR
jgi:hypothetical protein